MKTNKQRPTIKKVRCKSSLEEFYALPETKEIDGVEFIYVVKNLGTQNMPKLRRKDSLEYIVR